MCLDNHAQDNRCVLSNKDGKKTPCLSKKMGTGGNSVPLVLSVNNPRRNETGQEGEHDTSIMLRNITPIEVERLFGYPDNWTKYTAEGKQISNSQRYKMLGNSIALPQWKWLMKES